LMLLLDSASHSPTPHSPFPDTLSMMRAIHIGAKTIT
jgi:hypothetical protein